MYKEVSSWLTLFSIIEKLYPIQEKRIDFEVTGHYGMNLKEFLEDKNLSYMKINPILIKEFSINACEND